MKFWWVNHKQTHTDEITGGYIWSPKANSNGARNQTYTNLTLTEPGDIVFSYAGGLIKAIGLVTAPHREQPKPPEFGTTGDAWSDFGWAVLINWEMLDQPIRPKDHLDRIVPLLPTKNAPLQTNGNGNQSCYLAGISEELGNLMLSLTQELNHSFTDTLQIDQAEQEEDTVADSIRTSELDETEKEQLIMARRGQGLFRKNVEKMEHCCRVTGVMKKTLLIASHIKPWRLCNNSERLDGNNGLLLSPHIDRLFDQGWITFNNNGDLHCSGPEIEATLNQWGIFLPVNVGLFNSLQRKYMEFHRNNIFNADFVTST